MSKHDLAEKFEAHIVSAMNNTHRSLRDRMFRGILFTLSRCFRAVVMTRLWLYTERIFRQSLPGCQIISVGNLTVGGTGKTPVVEFLTGRLLEKGRKVAILSRGYRSKNKKNAIEKFKAKLAGEKDLPKIVSDGKSVLLDSEFAGDEPYMLAKNLLPAAVLVDKDRVKSCNYAIKNYHTDIIILDDGFQYLKLRPSYNICLVDSTNPFDNHHVLPRGLLREPIKHLRRANLIFLTKANQRRRASLVHLKKFIYKHNPEAKIIECSHKPKHLINIYTGEKKSVDFLKGKKVASLSGIAVPQGFENSIGKLGGDLIYKERFADHHRFHRKEIVDCYNKSVEVGADLVLTTEKDAVRIPDVGEKRIDVYYLKIEIGIYHGREYFDEFISKVLIEPKNHKFY